MLSSKVTDLELLNSARDMLNDHEILKIVGEGGQVEKKSLEKEDREKSLKSSLKLTEKHMQRKDSNIQLALLIKKMKKKKHLEKSAV